MSKLLIPFGFFIDHDLLNVACAFQGKKIKGRINAC